MKTKRAMSPDTFDRGSKIKTEFKGEIAVTQRLLWSFSKFFSVRNLDLVDGLVSQ